MQGRPKGGKNKYYSKEEKIKYKIYKNDLQLIEYCL